MENYLAVMYRIDAEVNAYCLEMGEDCDWKDDAGDRIYFCDIEERCWEERGYDAVRRALSAEYNLESGRDFKRCFNDYIKMVKYYLNMGRDVYDNKRLEWWLDFLEVQINKQEFKRQEKELLKMEE